MAAEDAVAPRGAAAEVGGAGQVAQVRITAGAAMIDARRRDVADAPAGRAQAPLPVLFVAGAAERLVERADPLERGAPDRQVRAPDELGLAVLLAEVERGDRQRFAPARAQVRALQARPDRAAEGLVGLVRDERVEPARPHLDVVVEEAHELPGGRAHRRIAGGVDAVRAAERDVLRAEALRERPCRRVLGVVLDDHDLRAVS